MSAVLDELEARFLVKDVSVLANEIKIELFSKIECKVYGIGIADLAGQQYSAGNIAFEINQNIIIIKDFREITEVFRSLQDIENAEICLILNGEDNLQSVLLKSENRYLKNAYISHIFGKVYLCYSADGILGLKKEGKSKISLGKDCEVQTRTLENIFLDDEKKLMEILVPEEYRECWQISFIVITASEENRLASCNKYICDGRYSINKYTRIRINYEEIYSYVEWIGKGKYVIIQLEARKENQIIRFILLEKGAKRVERYCYDIRNSNRFYCCTVRNQNFLRYYSNLGLTYKIIEEEERYIEQFNNGITDIGINGDSVLLDIAVRETEGKFFGLILRQGEHRKHIPCSVSAEGKLTVCFETGSLWKEFVSGEIEIYSVWKTNDLCGYLIENKLLRQAECDYVKTNKLICAEGTKLEFIVSQTGTLKLQLRLDDPFVEKNVVEYGTNVIFSEFINLINQRKRKSKGTVKCDIFDVNETFFKISMVYEKRIDSMVAVYHSDSDTIIKNVSVVQQNNYQRTFRVEFPYMDDYTKVKHKSTYRVWLGICCAGNCFLLAVRGIGKEHKSTKLNAEFDRQNYFYNPIAHLEIETKTCSVIPYFALNGNFSLSITENIRSYIGQFSNCIEDVSIKDGKLILRATCQKLRKGEYKGFILQYRGKVENDIEYRKIEYSEIRKEDVYDILQAEIEIKDLGLRMIYWDIFSWMSVEKQDYIINLFCRDDYLANKYQETYNCDAYIINEKSIVYPYVTKTNSVALAHREYYMEFDRVEFRELEQKVINEYEENKTYYDSQNIYLVYEKYCTAAQDNGYYFFLYCMKNQVEKEVNGHIYYVIDKKKADYQRIKQYDDHVIQFGSYEHLLFLLSARLYISTDTKEHAFVFRARGSKILANISKKEYVFLQHGVTGLKKIDHVYAKGKYGQCLRFVTTSVYEKNIIIKYFKYGNNEVITTGFARWDVLEDKSENKRQILIVPTWRSWLDDVENDVFINSEYFLRYMELLNDSRLYSLLEKYDVVCYFYIHIKFKDYITNFEKLNNKKVNIIAFGEKPLNELLMESKLLITDYSSVSWDMFYQGKPVLFYQFDLDDYMHAHGSYMNLKEELFGDRGETLEELFEQLEDYMAADFEMKPRFASQRKKYFKYFDGQNSARIWMEIKKCSHIKPKVSVKKAEAVMLDYEYLLRESRNGHIGLITLLGMIKGWLKYKLIGRIKE